jgi:hypothetical protein
VVCLATFDIFLLLFYFKNSLILLLKYLIVYSLGNMFVKTVASNYKSFKFLDILKCCPSFCWFMLMLACVLGIMLILIVNICMSVWFVKCKGICICKTCRLHYRFPQRWFSSTECIKSLAFFPDLAVISPFLLPLESSGFFPHADVTFLCRTVLAFTFAYHILLWF